jgi:hypothetical protein
MTQSRGRPVGVTKEESPLLKAYEEKIKMEMRVMLAAKNLSQKEVAWALERAGIKESAKGLSSKMNAGTCSAAYFLAFKDVVDSI